MLVVRLVVLVTQAIVRSVVGRLRNGPADSTWSWRMTLTRDVLHDVIAGLQRRADVDEGLARGEGARLDARAQSPMPRRLRVVMERVDDELGGVPCERLVRAGHTDGVLLYLHGGGYVMGSPGTHRHLVAELAWAARTDAVVPDYRLAPAFPFPAAIDDAVAVYNSLLEADVAPERIVVAGDSAGGGLTMALLLRLRDEGSPLPAAAVCFSPYVNLCLDCATMTSNSRTDYLPLSDTALSDWYLQGQDPRHPYASPVYADLSGLPPILVFAGGREVLLDDCRALSIRLREFGNKVVYREYEHMFHVWPAIVPRERDSMLCIDEFSRFVSDSLRTAAESGRPTPTSDALPIT